MTNVTVINYRNTVVRLILASRSPRRSKILKQIGLEFEVIPSSVDENFPAGLSPRQMVEYISGCKAEAVAANNDHAVIVAADTVVVLNGHILGKPEDEQKAASMLGRLSGKTHNVYTGVTLIRTKAPAEPVERVQFSERTKVTFATLSEEEISAYVRGGSPLDKAGSYGIQDDLGSAFVTRIEGDYYNVVGLPVHLFYRHMKIIAPEIMFKDR